MNRHLRYLRNLAVLAEDVAPVNGAKISACIVLNNKIVSYGHNSYKTHPLQKKFNRGKYNVEPTKDSKVERLGFAPPSEPICVHAEILAIANAVRRIHVDDLRNSTLYVARVKYTSKHKTSLTWGNAKPCEICSGARESFGIKRVFYTCEGVDNYAEC